VGDIQQFYAAIMVKTNPCLGTLHEAVQTLKLDAANNKLRMIDWLKDDLGIDYESLSLRSFVHMKHELCVEIYALLCGRLDCVPKILFTSRLWHVRDTKPCEHGKVRCQCAQ
jgi:hypothetical protein